MEETKKNYEEMSTIELPHDGVVDRVDIINITNFIGTFGCDKPFKILSKLEDAIIGKKIRKLERGFYIPLESGRGIVAFELSGYVKTGSCGGEVDIYTVYYRYAALFEN